MNTFKRKALTCAVLAGIGGMATTAEAVYRNPDGTGQVLVYPYYTVNSSGNNAFNTYISVTNTTSVAKVLKVRFREGRASAEVLDFNLYLSPNDVWVGGLAPQSADAASPAVLFGNFETSCTYPFIPALGQPFVNTAYLSGTGLDLGGQTGVDRTREGYVEIFDMATLTGTAAANVTHTGIGVRPPNCTAMQTNLLAVGSPFLGQVTNSVGGIYGEATIINVPSGASFGYKADALDAYRSGQFYSDVAFSTPQLGGDAAPVSLVMANNRAVTDVWGAGPAGTPASAGARAIAAVFMHSSVMNDYILESGPRSNTDWVLTFPGKIEFVTTTTASPPFTALLTTAGACENATFTFFDRDEQNSVPPPGGFSPQSSGTGGPGTGQLCWESTVLSVRNGRAHTTASDISTTNLRSGVLGSRNVQTVTVQPSANVSFESGWLDLAFTGANALAGIGSIAGADMAALAPVTVPPAVGLGGGVSTARVHTFFGLPVTGFMVTARANASTACTLPSGAAGTCAGNYMALFTHSYRTRILP
jgi:hypothetical protein